MLHGVRCKLMQLASYIPAIFGKPGCHALLKFGDTPVAVAIQRRREDPVPAAREVGRLRKERIFSAVQADLLAGPIDVVKVCLDGLHVSLGPAPRASESKVPAAPRGWGGSPNRDPGARYPAGFRRPRRAVPPRAAKWRGGWLSPRFRDWRGAARPGARGGRAFRFKAACAPAPVPARWP